MNDRDCNIVKIGNQYICSYDGELVMVVDYKQYVGALRSEEGTVFLVSCFVDGVLINKLIYDNDLVSI